MLWLSAPAEAPADNQHGRRCLRATSSPSSSHPTPASLCVFPVTASDAAEQGQASLAVASGDPAPTDTSGFGAGSLPSSGRGSSGDAVLPAARPASTCVRIGGPSWPTATCPPFSLTCTRFQTCFSASCHRPPRPSPAMIFRKHKHGPIT